MKHRLLLPLLFLALTGQAFASPTQFGDTGLLSEPSADTLNAGNICLGLWANSSSGDRKDALIVPVSITLGLGTFLEFYGSYPNLLFNDDEAESGRGFVNLGAKIRFWGERSSPFKLAIDGQARRSIADDPEADGLTDYAGRVIASYKPGRFGAHINAGYSMNDSSDTLAFEDQVLYGGGIEFYPATRLRLIAELSGATERISGGGDLREATAGFQYFISPHLTLNVGVGMGFSDASPDWRALVGFSTCQGIGTYVKPVPRIIEPVSEEKKVEQAPAKSAKVKTLTPLIPPVSSKDRRDVAPLSQYEVPVAPEKQEVVVHPSERLVIPESEKEKALPIAPIPSSVPSDGAKVKDAGKEQEAKQPSQPLRTVLYRHFRIPELSFEFNQSELSQASKKAISEIVEQLSSEKKFFLIRIEGHTDSIGSYGYNERLSLKRAQAAATYLSVHTGFDSSRIFVQAYGERRPIATNMIEAGRSQNRRIELLVLLPEGEKGE